MRDLQRLQGQFLADLQRDTTLLPAGEYYDYFWPTDVIVVGAWGDSFSVATSCSTECLDG